MASPFYGGMGGDELLGGLTGKRKKPYQLRSEGDEWINDGVYRGNTPAAGGGGGGGYNPYQNLRRDPSNWDDYLGNIIEDYRSQSRYDDLFRDFLGGYQAHTDKKIGSFWRGGGPASKSVRQWHAPLAGSAHQSKQFWQPGSQAWRSVSQYHKPQGGAATWMKDMWLPGHTASRDVRQWHEPLAGAADIQKDMWQPGHKASSAVRQWHQPLKDVADQYGNLSLTGGFSDKDRALYRARATGGTPAIENMMQRRDARFSGGANDARIGKDFARLLGEQRLGTEATLSDQIRQGQLAGMSGRAGILDTLRGSDLALGDREQAGLDRYVSGLNQLANRDMAIGDRMMQGANLYAQNLSDIANRNLGLGDRAQAGQQDYRNTFMTLANQNMALGDRNLGARTADINRNLQSMMGILGLDQNKYNTIFGGLSTLGAGKANPFLQGAGGLLGGLGGLLGGLG